MLGLSFVAAGLREGERGLYVSFQETPAELTAKAEALGWEQVAQAYEQKQLDILHIRPVDLELDQVGVAMRDALAQRQPARVVVDSIAELDLGGRAPDRYLSYLWAMVNLVKGYEATGLFSQETITFGPQPSTNPLSYVFENVITMRFVEYEYRVLRAVSTLKMRRSQHQTDLVEFAIGPGGITAGDKLTGVTGLLGWSALRKED